MNPFTYDSPMRNISIQATFFSSEVHICATKITKYCWCKTRPTQGVGIGVYPQLWVKTPPLLLPPKKRTLILYRTLNIFAGKKKHIIFFVCSKTSIRIPRWSIFVAPPSWLHVPSAGIRSPGGHGERLGWGKPFGIIIPFHTPKKTHRFTGHTLVTICNYVTFEAQRILASRLIFFSRMLPNLEHISGSADFWIGVDCNH